MHTQMRYGFISDVDPAKGLAKVWFQDDDDGNGGNFVTDWLPVLFSKTMSDKATFPMDVNEHVVCMMDEYCENGIIMGSIYSTRDTPNGAGADIHRVLFKDGSSVQFDRSSGEFTADIKGKMNLKSGGDLTITASAKMTANVTGDIAVATQGKATVQATGNVEVTTSAQAKVTAATANITAPTVSITGSVTVSGALTAASLTASSGAITGGGVTASGGTLTATNVIANVNIIAGGDVQAGALGGISLRTHTHNVTAVGSPTGPSLP